MFQELKWMNIYTRIKYFQAILMYKCTKGLTPNYLSENITPCSNVHNYSTRSTTSGYLHVPRPNNTDYFKRTFKYSGLIIWNALPKEIKYLDNINSFKSRCADYFLMLQNTNNNH